MGVERAAAAAVEVVSPSREGAGLFLYRSHRVERLADVLVDDLRAGGGDPFRAASVVVGSRGMERWLRARIADGLGICANVDFRFPAAVLGELVADVLGEVAPTPDPWAPECLAWRLLERLPEVIDREELADVRAYLRAGGGEGAANAVDRRRWGLAREVADLLDRYAVSRGDWIAEWLEGRPPGELVQDGQEVPAARWQRVLFADLRAAVGRPSFPERAAAALARLDAAAPGSLSVPSLHVFGVTALPASTLRLLAGASRAVPVHLYLFAPSPLYWAEYRTRAEARGAERRAPTLARVQDVEESMARQNPLLTAFGRISRDMQALVLEWAEAAREPYGDALHDADPIPGEGGPTQGGPSLLRWIQDDVRELASPAVPGAAGDGGVRWPGDDDDSLAFHACHGPTRQVEVLRDALLALFDRHRELEPRDVVVMTPDIETYAPLVEAVFGEGREAPVPGAPPDAAWGPVGGPRIPIEVADLALRRLNPVADALLRTLELADGRATATAVADLMGQGGVRRRFGLSEDDVSTARGWLRDAGIRWGWDAADRDGHGQPEEGQNTFLWGLRRLALGVVMADEGRVVRPSGASPGDPPLLPFDDMEGEGARVFGRFAAFCDGLARAVESVAAPTTVPGWAGRLRGVVDSLVDPGGDAAWQREQVVEALDDLVSEAGSCGADVDLSALRQVVSGRFEVPRGGDRPVSGAVTVCALAPMRSVPFPVVCLLGMDDGVFPRKAPELGFDLTRLTPRAGDRDPRDEDRHLLLEALMSARSHLLVLYTGQDARTGAPSPPAVPVAELLDALDASFPAPGGEGTLRDRVLFRHPVQPFSPRGFLPGAVAGAGPGRDEPFSHDVRMRDAARGLARRRTGSLALFRDGPLPEVPVGAVSIDALARSLIHPVRFLMRERLRLWLEEGDDTLADREPTAVDGLVRWALDRRLLAAALSAPAGEPDWGEVEAACRATGTLPLGAAGRRVLAERRAVVAVLMDRAGPRLEGAARRRPVRVTVGEIGLSGTSPLLDAGGDLLDVDTTEPDRAKRLVRAWVGLLALQAAEPRAGRQAVLYGASSRGGRIESKAVVLAAPAEPDPVLADLLDVHRAALHRPIPLFEATSCAFAAAMAEEEGPWGEAGPEVLSRAASRAVESWEADESGGRRGDGDDPYLRAVHGGRVPCLSADGRSPDPEFVRFAERLWRPLMDAKRPGKDA
ncbi:exodeoxyribonuclease V subunit gamma [Myxococcota bacterium]|nr:exodeoxyribonuclease V subunit gamma [Myxococcota bacterium]